MALKVLILKGLPASGKSTYAKELLEKEPGRWKRVNKDDLRAMLDNGKWSSNNEGFILALRNHIIWEALVRGFNVVVDDTNLAPQHESEIQQLVAKFNTQEDRTPEKVQFGIKFFDVSVSECVCRDAERPNGVGAKAIYTMYNQFLKPQVTKAEYIDGLPEAIICDLDGTLALNVSRSPYDTALCETDELNEPVFAALQALTVRDIIPNTEGRSVIIVSGRSDKFRKETENWLFHKGIVYDTLFMRKDGDQREDSIIKQEIYDAEIKGKYNVFVVLDDRQRVVDMWRRNGLIVFQVADGQF